MKRQMMAGAALLMVLLMGATGWAMGGGCGKGYCGSKEGCNKERKSHGGDHLARMFNKLDLSDEQKSRVDEIIAAEKEKVAPLRTELKEGRLAIKEASLAVPFDENRVRDLLEQKEAVRTELMVSKARTKNALFALLTPEQQKEAQEMFDRKEKRHHRKMENRQ